jgi:hypothetical protein
MRILFDQGVPRGLTASRRNHEVTEGRKLNRERISNGELIAPAEGAGFHLLLHDRQESSLPKPCWPENIHCDSGPIGVVACSDGTLTRSPDR